MATNHLAATLHINDLFIWIGFSHSFDFYGCQRIVSRRRKFSLTSTVYDTTEIGGQLRCDCRMPSSSIIHAAAISHSLTDEHNASNDSPEHWQTHTPVHTRTRFAVSAQATLSIRHLFRIDIIIIVMVILNCSKTALKLLLEMLWKCSKTALKLL